VDLLLLMHLTLHLLHLPLPRKRLPAPHTYKGAGTPAGGWAQEMQLVIGGAESCYGVLLRCIEVLGGAGRYREVLGGSGRW